MPDSRRLFEDSLDLIDQVVSWVAARHCLAGGEAEDFRSVVHLRLIENDYRVLREFAGRSSLQTYLTTVVLNFARDHRMKRWGRWRPSAQAERDGLVAVQLETLLRRDGFSFDEAVEKLRSDHGVRLTRSELDDLAARLPDRARPRVESDEGVVERVAGSDWADRGALDRERRGALERAQEILRVCLAELEVAERLLLELHYARGLTISAIARTLGLDQRRAYSSRDRSLARVRRCVEAGGMDGATVLDALGRPEARFAVHFGAADAVPDKKEPSNLMSGGAGEIDNEQ